VAGWLKQLMKKLKRRISILMALSQKIVFIKKPPLDRGGHSFT
jgi:hypothetical protein